MLLMLAKAECETSQACQNQSKGEIRTAERGAVLATKLESKLEQIQADDSQGQPTAVKDCQEGSHSGETKLKPYLELKLKPSYCWQASSKMVEMD